MSVVIITPPDPILDVATARARLGIAASTDDATILSWVASATQAIDGPTGWLNRAIGVQTLELSLPGFPCDLWGRFWRQRYHWHIDDTPEWSIDLPYPEIVSVTSVSYTDPDGNPQTVDPTQYALVDRLLVPAFGVVWPVSRNSPGSVRIRYQAGYVTVLEPIKQAILLSVSQMRSMQGRDPALTVDTVYGVGSQQFSANVSTGFSASVQAMLEQYRVIA